jgi:hypothetical protein
MLECLLWKNLVSPCQAAQWLNTARSRSPLVEMYCLSLPE